MSFRETLLLAWEALTANKLRAGLTMLGMIIGVGAVVLLVSIGNGAKNYITAEFEGLGTNLIIIQPGKMDKKSTMGPPLKSAEKLTREDAEAIERLSTSLAASTGVSFGAAAVKRLEKTTNVSLVGSNEKWVQIFNIETVQGTFFSREEYLSGRRVVVLGYGVARSLFGDENPLGQVIRVNESEHRVIGVTGKTGNKLGFDFDEVVFVPLRSAMRIFNEERLFGIRARAKSRNSLNEAIAEVTELLKARHNGEEDFTILTQVSMMQSMNTILNMLTYVLGGIAMISMLVGGIGIMNIMLVSVTERTREIGIRRAVGARRRDVLRQFMVEAIVLSMMGGGIGLFGSVSITYIVSWIFNSFDMRAPFWIMLPAFFLSFFTGIIFGVWPARKASKIETIDALRFE